MIIKDTRNFDLLRSREPIKLECELCHKEFYKPKNQVLTAIKNSSKNTFCFCSLICQQNKIKINNTYKCANCNKEIYKTPGVLKKNKGNRVFCSQSCAAIYNNSHNTDRKFGPSQVKACKYCPTIVGSKKTVCEACIEIRAEEKNKRKIEKLSAKCDICLNKKEIKIICRSCKMLLRRLKSKKKCIEYKGGKCNICGYNKSFRALAFHHINPKLKSFGISNNLYGNWDNLKKELDKCLLLCANCHAEFHSKLIKEKYNAKL